MKKTTAFPLEPWLLVVGVEILPSLIFIGNYGKSHEGKELNNQDSMESKSWSLLGSSASKSSELRECDIVDYERV